MESQVLTRPLFSSREPKTFQSETIEHREIVLLRASGLRPAAIAARMKCSIATVSNVIRTPWALEMLGELANKAVGKEVEKHMSSVANEALLIARNIMRETEDEKLQAQCAFKFLELSVGKKLEVTKKDKRSLAELEKESQQAAEEILKLRNGSN